MEKLTFDTGIREFEINGREILRFNPSDPNLYHRFFDTCQKIEELAAEYAKKIPSDPVELDGKGYPVASGQLAAMHDYDSQAKKLLSEVFGAENDFDRILGGVNLLAVARNGKCVINNFLEAMMPIIQDGAERYAKAMADAAVAQAKQNREQRRAPK